jgi:hypothetical protein
MTSSRAGLGLLSLVPLAAFLAGGCGNYSNEDLEYMNALPESSDVRVNIPSVTGAVELANEAELARATHNTTRGLNGLATALVDIVDYVRSFPPTARTASSRIWGPFPADKTKMKNLDWETRMIVSRDDTVMDQLDYEIAVHHDGAPDTDWPVLIGGWFKAGHTARRGVGHVELITAAGRAEGLDVSDLGMLDHLEIDYDTLDEPISITMSVTNLPDPTSTSPPAKLTYSYFANAAGQGQMTFDLFANIPGTGPAIEDMRIFSQWLGTGEGRATLTIVSGDGMGLRQVECWGPSFAPTFNDKPWMTGEDVPGNPPGDPAAFCPNISDLSVVTAPPGPSH